MIRFIGLLLVVFFFCNDVMASPPPSFYVVRQWVSRLRDVRSLELQSEIFRASGESKALHYKERLSVDLENRSIHSELLTVDGAKICDTYRKLRLDETLQIPGLDFLFFEKDEISLIAALKARGLPFKTEDHHYMDRVEPPSAKVEQANKNTSAKVDPDKAPKPAHPWDSLKKYKYLKPEAKHVVRSGDTLRWVYGVDLKNSSLPFLSFQKDAFVPLEWSEKVKIEFSSYKMEKSFSYPGVIVVPDASLRIELREVTLNPKRLSSNRGSSCANSDSEEVQAFYRYVR